MDDSLTVEKLVELYDSVKKDLCIIEPVYVPEDYRWDCMIIPGGNKL